ncbi:hypothetical protein [Arthrobacter sp. ZGTC412]|uniref:hypothetical protein n=1 Tax=Arthrobacter sp. ZGTC412 TaxID=2058900 RepID=UPI0021588451|nr:hypothetical protein [Arthrobacter sp. ZGTC412]
MLTDDKLRHLDAAELIAAVLDPGSYRSWDTRSRTVNRAPNTSRNWQQQGKKPE